MPGTLPEILQQKEKGDQWYSYIAPEEYHVWQSPWEPKRFRKYGINILSVGITANETISGTKNEKKYTSRSPLYLEDTGVSITSGSIATKQKRHGSFKFRVDSVIELNDAIVEIVQLTEINFWVINNMEIANPQTGGICQFRRHNPDGNGTSFYFWSLGLDKGSILYPDVCKTDQEHYLGSFKQHFAACECSEALQKFHGCVINKNSRKAIK